MQIKMALHTNKDGTYMQAQAELLQGTQNVNNSK